jgi:hypothetical protein
MRWSQLKKRVEDNFSDSLKKRIVFHTTRYSKFCSCCGRLWIEIDGSMVLDTSTINYHYEERKIQEETGQSAETIRNGLNQKDCFAQHHFTEDMFDFLNYSIDEALKSKRPVIRALAMLDKRLGKRRLQVVDVSQETALVKRFYQLRCDADRIHIKVDELCRDSLTSKIDTPWPKKIKIISDETSAKADQNLVSRKANKLKTLIKKIQQKQITKDNLTNERYKEIFDFIEHSSNVDVIFETILFLEKRSKLCRDDIYLKGILNLIKDKDVWIRDIIAWQPQSHNAAKQFASLIRFLLCAYDIPKFMDKAYLEGNATHQSWLKHLGAGNNIRTCKNLPVELTKKMAHYFLEAPSHYSINGALRWGQVYALGGDQRLCDVLLETRLAVNFDHDDFWLTVIAFFVRNPMLDIVHINPIIDYIAHRKFENRVAFVEQGVAQQEGPAQPNFNMRGRTPEALLNEVEIWHRYLGREVTSGKLQWKKSRIKDFEFIEGTKESKNMRIWRIRELLSSAELIAEGRAMQHCVASYAQSCNRGGTTIWTLERETEDGREKILTIELSVKDGLIKQVRGRKNRFADDKERSVISRWMENNGLAWASYLRGNAG